MIAEETKDFAWSELLELEKHVRYYDELASRYRLKSSVAKLLIFFLSLAIPAVSTSIHSPPGWTLLVAGLFAAGLVAWDYMNGHEGEGGCLARDQLRLCSIASGPKRLVPLGQWWRH